MNKKAAHSARRRAPAKIIESRDDLSFTQRDGEGRLINWSVPHDKNGNWSAGVEIGLQHFSEVAELAQLSEYEAFSAIEHALNTYGWQQGGWGIEMGFTEALAAAAIVGLRALRSGAEPYDRELELKQQIEAEDGGL